MTPAEARKILNVGLHATKEEIKKAWRSRAMDTHPDRGGNAKDFAKVQSAYTRLIQPSTATDTMESEIFETMFADIFNSKGINMENAEELEKMINKESQQKSETKPIRVRKPKYPTNQKKKNP